MTASAGQCPTPLDLIRGKTAKPVPASKPAPAAQDNASPHRKRPARKPSTPKPPAARPVTAADAIAPGRLEKAEHFRPFYRLGMTISGMPAPARLVGHDLLWRAQHDTGRILAAEQPTAEVLADSTGLHPAQVLVGIEVLRTRGWLITRHLRSGQEAYDLVIPTAFLERIRQLRKTRHRT